MNTGPTLRRGSTGEDVRRVQRILVMIKELGPTDIDGIFGLRTENAVKSFQSSSGLAADAIVGPKTWAALPADPNTPQIGMETTGAVVAAVQQVLRDFGGVGAPTDPGPIDATFGPRTEAAVRAYQRDEGYRMTGSSAIGPGGLPPVQRELPWRR